MSKRVLIIMAIVVVLLGAAGFGVAYALGQSGQASTPATAATVGTNPSSTGPGQRNNVRGASGVIQSLNNQTIVITLLRGKRTMNVTLSANTKYFTLEGQATFSDLKVGEAVNVVGQFDAQAQALNALRVVILPPLGQVTAINGQTLTLTTYPLHTAINVTMNNATVVYIAFGVRSIAISARAIEIGQILGYQGTTANNGSVNATKLWLIGLPQVRGTVTSVNSTTLTLQTVAGASVTINLSPNTTYIQGPLRRTPVASNAQAIQVGSTVAVATDSRPASNASTAVLVIVMAG